MKNPCRLGVTLLLGVLHAMASAQTPPSPRLRYTFRPEDCSVGSFWNQASAEPLVLLRNRNVTTCAPSLGVDRLNDGVVVDEPVFGLVSEDSLGSVLTSTDGIALELWLQPTNGTPVFTNERSLVSILRGTPDPQALTYCDQRGLDLEVLLVDSTLKVYYRTSDDILEPCQRLIVEDALEYPLSHVVVSLAHGQQQVFVNGQSYDVLQRPFDNRLPHWSTNSQLSLLAAPDTRLYQVSLFAMSFSIAQVRDRMRDGLPPSPAYALNRTVVIQEDAEVATHDDPLWYRQSPSVDEAAPIALSVVALDRRVYTLLDRWQLELRRALDPVYIYVTRLPSLGHLYQSNGRMLEPTTNATLVPVMLNGTAVTEASLLYVPPLNAYSTEDEPLTSFDYCVSNMPLFHVQQCLSTVTLQIVVRSVNDPPIAMGGTVLVVTEGIETLATPRVLLSGTDVDENDAISMVEITEQPMYGQLILSVSSFRKDGLLHGVPLADLGNVASTNDDNDPVYVKYVWNNQSSIVVQDDSVQDSFGFRVADRAGKWSAPEVVHVDVRTAVLAVPHEEFVVAEDSRVSNNLVWHSVDQSGYQRRMGYFVESVPDGEMGVLLESSAVDGPVQAGSLLSTLEDFPYDQGASLTFVPSPNYCNSRRMETKALEMETQLRFRTVAVVGTDNRVVTASDIVTQPIRVDCLIDAMSLKGPFGPFVLKQTGLRRASTDLCRGFAFDPAVTDLATCDAAAVINGIDVTSTDSHVEPVHVTVFAGNGYVTFNEQSWDRVRPIYGRRVVAANNVTFVANPEDLTDVLAHLHFQSYHLGNDTIDVLLQYGDCSSFQVNRSSTPFRTTACQVLRHTVSVHVVEDENAGKTSTSLVTGFPWQILICALGYPALYFAWVQARRAWNRKWGDDETVSAPDVDLGDDLPDWTEYLDDESGNYFYVHKVSGEKRWDPPDGQDFDEWKEEEDELKVKETNP